MKKQVADLSQVGFVLLFASEFTGPLCGQLSTSYWLLVCWVGGLFMQELHQGMLIKDWAASGYNLMDVRARPNPNPNPSPNPSPDPEPNPDSDPNPNPILTPYPYPYPYPYPFPYPYPYPYPYP